MQLTERHVFDTDADTFWNRLFFDEEYNRRIHEEVLKFKAFQVLEDREQGGGVRVRKLRVEPGFDAPGPIKKIIGERMTYLESGRFEPTDRRWRYSVTPSVLSDKVSISAEVWVEPRGDKKIERFARIDVSVRLFGVGGLIESFVEKVMHTSYEKVSRFTNQFILERGW